MKATLVLEDNDDGTLQMSVTFDPPVTDKTEVTAAGTAAMRCMRLIAGQKMDEVLEEDDDKE